MRDIKFRQKLKPHFVRGSGEFHYWGYIDGDFTSPVGKNYCDTPDEQFTGLKDINGVEIYEGDIVREVRLLSEGKRTTNLPVEYQAPSFVAGELQLSNYMGITREVIGNIHQNPELLEQYNG